MRCLLAVVAVAALLATAASAKPVHVQANTYDFLMMVYQWPPNVCATEATAHNCVIPADSHLFTIHGLWPSRNDTTYPQSCCSSCSFNATAVQDLLPQLNQYWPNLFAEEAATDFWSHEYLKHGTCATDVASLDTEHSFFATTLGLSRQLNVDAAFAKLKPSTTTGYSLATVQAAIKAYFGAEGYLTCETYKGQQLVTGFGLCVTKNNFAVFQCDPRVYGENSCKSTSDLFFLPF
ncbi:ribonuclease T2 family protein [Capsaspora owczarzaki ATCC 30864]|uniref:Ribonuclease T2 family protein n=1 Tax=Capsaspora owczarzaki (strain ATCC 30864) TaxID=595528 RepID=A0A0D2VMD5_CAPO3|nr:ribonuclease T2 family protein [Capsaspora owczarzaki ATCC 30864]KJE91317.1 ribonuclease T2 family protein [Capsaspora owczarzaki ATCC 30864]|eukprot:XP_004349220.1 ribonuclease T2 family protein [Capsaspora owczarzaki ATCC 30864]